MLIGPDDQCVPLSATWVIPPGRASCYRCQYSHNVDANAIKASAHTEAIEHTSHDGGGFVMSRPAGTLPVELPTMPPNRRCQYGGTAVRLGSSLGRILRFGAGAR